MTDPTITEAERDAYKRACQSAGVCMSCVLRAPEPYGCTDCLNTGFDGGDPREQIKAVEAALARYQSERAKGELPSLNQPQA